MICGKFCGKSCAMATLRKKKGTANFLACFTNYSGKRIQKTTGIPVRREAQKKADELEREAQTPPAPIPPPKVSVRAWAAEWLALNKGSVEGATYLAYDGRADHFLKHLGSRADQALEAITKADIVAYRAVLADIVSASTANHAVKILRMMFEAARREKVIPENPATDIKPLKGGERTGRRPFSLQQIMALLKAADPEWKSMILFGLYTGQRLSDLALMTWEMVDREAQEIRFQTRKTDRYMAIPLAAPLARHVAAMNRPADGKAFVHPASAKWARAGKTKKCSTLSRRFRDLMADAGIGERKKHRRTEDRQGARRKPSELSFHSFRHTATSLMKNAGISEAVVMDIIGHDSPAVSAIYTHIDTSAKRKALDSMPDLVG